MQLVAHNTWTHILNTYSCYTCSLVKVDWTVHLVSILFLFFFFSLSPRLSSSPSAPCSFYLIYLTLYMRNDANIFYMFLKFPSSLNIFSWMYSFNEEHSHYKYFYIDLCVCVCVCTSNLLLQLLHSIKCNSYYYFSLLLLLVCRFFFSTFFPLNFICDTW